jgi:hypothetical protein
MNGGCVYSTKITRQFNAQNKEKKMLGLAPSIFIEYFCLLQLTVSTVGIK